jgi:hypothetical protein|nr:MAG TPA: hypothetical protein [Caudoviricetes sp.]
MIHACFPYAAFDVLFLGKHTFHFLARCMIAQEKIALAFALV